MKTRRTLSADILLSAEYRKLSASAQSLYIFSIMSADEYGFIENTYKFVCTNGYKMDDLNNLYKAGLIIVFPNESMLITDWFVHTGTMISLDEKRNEEYQYIHINENGRFIELDSLKEVRRKVKKQKAFIPPTLEEVKEYAASRNSVVNPIEFFNYFNTPNENGDTWVDSKGHLVMNWKGKFVTWEKFREGNNARNTTRVHKPSATGDRRWNISYDIDGTTDEA